MHSTGNNHAFAFMGLACALAWGARGYTGHQIKRASDSLSSHTEAFCGECLK